MVDNERSRFKLGLHQAKGYFRFLWIRYQEDVIQEVQIALLETKDQKLNVFNNAVNRRLYKLARNMGWRRTNPYCCPNDLERYGDKTVYVHMFIPMTEFEGKLYSTDRDKSQRY